MNVLIICLIIAVILPYLVKVPLGYAMSKAPGGYDNEHPRLQTAQLQGFGARALGAHQNCFESLLVFSTAVLTALATAHLSVTIQNLAIVYIISRLVYVFLYLKNWASLRSTIWFLGFACCIAILALCL